MARRRDITDGERFFSFLLVEHRRHAAADLAGKQGLARRT